METWSKQRTRLQQDFPWVDHPFISNAPMSGFATNVLAVAVAQAGGFGLIGFTGSPHIMDRELETAMLKLRELSLYQETCNVLPVGVGIIAIGGSYQHWMPTFSKYHPAMAWLSFGTTHELEQWAVGIRAASPDTKVWIQVGSVAAALEVATACNPDALVMQGNDAGGHGHKYGASIVTLVPEVADALHEQGLSHIPLIAAGGIMDKRGLGAALLLGASGVVMGTRFLACEETQISEEVVDEVIAASDGGQTTVRSRAFDDIWGPNAWPDMYDGRCLRNAIFDNLEEKGMSVEEAQMDLHRRNKPGQIHGLSVRDTHTIWAGTGVGLLKKREKAGDIVKQIRHEMQGWLQHWAKDI